MSDDLPAGGPPPHVGGMSHDMTDEHNSIFFAAITTTRMPMVFTDPNPHRATTEWMARYVLDPLIHDMHFVKVEEPKFNTLWKLSDHYDIVAFVEDNLLHAMAALPLIKHVYLVKRSWNRKFNPAYPLHHVDTALQAAQAITGL